VQLVRKCSLQRNWRRKKTKQCRSWSKI